MLKFFILSIEITNLLKIFILCIILYLSSYLSFIYHRSTWYLCVSVPLCTFCHSSVESRGQLASAGFLLPPCGFWNLNSGCQYWWQEPSSTGPSSQPTFCPFVSSLFSFCGCNNQSPYLAHRTFISISEKKVIRDL